MNRCKAYTIQPKKCKMFPVKEKDYCRHHSNYDHWFVSKPKKHVGIQTEKFDQKGGRIVSFCLFLFYFVMYCFVIFHFVKFKVSWDEKF
jgi:hypothetical protein